LIKKLDSTKSSRSKFGKTEKAVDDTPDQLQCKHFGTCAGCTIKGNFADAPVVKRATNFFSTEDIKLNVHSIPTALQWRTHVKLAVQPMSRWGGIKIGLYKAGSHTVEPIPDCRVHHPRINEAVEELKNCATDLGVKGYSQATEPGQLSQGELRYIQMSLSRQTGKIQLVLVWNCIDYKSAGQTLPRLVKKLKNRDDLWHSITVNFQTAETNTIFNFNKGSWKLLWGLPTLKEKVGSANFFFQPQIFRQANLDAFESGIIPMVASNVPEGSTVAELYAGIGILGLNVAHRAAEVTCSDSNEYVDATFDRSADSLPESEREKVFYESLAAEDAVEQGQCENADVLIVDPPRRGLDDGVLKLLLGKHETATAQALKRVIYVSCGYDALEKDTRTLLASGLWRLKSTDGFVLFPGSDHVEIVAVFDRKGSASSSSSSSSSPSPSASVSVPSSSSSSSEKAAARSPKSRSTRKSNRNFSSSSSNDDDDDDEPPPSSINRPMPIDLDDLFQ